MLAGQGNVVILGAGMSGMAAARTLRGLDCTLYEARPHAGGHASSFRVGQRFLFDEGPHVSFTRNARVKRFLARSVNDRFGEFPTRATNYFEGAILKHPVQSHLHGLSREIITACIVDFVAAQHQAPGPIGTYKDWCYRAFGAAFSERFTRCYTRKYWNVELEQLTADWIANRIHVPGLEEMLRGALSNEPAACGYLSTFRYPLEKGFGGYNALLEQDVRIELGMRAVELDLDRRKISFENGTTVHYDHLISSAPLPELVKLCRDTPPAVREAADKLACTSHFILSVGIERPQVSDSHWTYFYDEAIPFSRASFPSKFSPENAPEGCSSIQVEAVHSRYKPLADAGVLLEQCLDSLIKVGLLESRAEIVALDARDIRYANVIFDFDRAANVAVVHEYLHRKGVQCCGRYGDWDYLWTDQAILSGERAANEVRRLLGLECGRFDDAVRTREALQQSSARD